MIDIIEIKKEALLLLISRAIKIGRDNPSLSDNEIAGLFINELTYANKD